MLHVNRHEWEQAPSRESKKKVQEADFIGAGDVGIGDIISFGGGDGRTTCENRCRCHSMIMVDYGLQSSVPGLHNLLSLL